MRLTREQVRQIDQRAIEEYGVPGIVLMENAAIGAARVAWEMVKELDGREVLVVCGGGNNGGDGLAVARHLHNLGAVVRIAPAIDPQKYKGDAKINFEIVQRMKLPFVDPRGGLAVSGAGIIVDALFGTGLDRAIAEPYASLIDSINGSGRPVLAIDVPSGLDCNTGQVLGICVRATRTVTFVAEKAGFDAPNARQFLGEVTVCGIGCPRELIEEIAGAGG